MNAPKPVSIHALAHSDSVLSEITSSTPTTVNNHKALTVLCAAFQHIDKQRWVASVVADILNTDLAELGRLGGFSHPDNAPQKGKVPGLNGWSYYFHGCGCCLTHDDGTEVDVDFPEGRYDIIDPYFFGNYLDSLSSPTILQSRLIEKEPLKNNWMAELPVLKEMGWIKGQHGFEITTSGRHEALKHLPLWNKIDAIDNVYTQAHLAIKLGDLALARSCLSNEKHSKSYSNISHLLVDADKHKYNALLQSTEGKTEYERNEVLKSAAALGDSCTKQTVNHILKHYGMDSTILLAIELIGHLGVKHYAMELEKLVSKAWRRKPPQPAIRTRAIRLLLSMYTPDTLPEKLLKKFRRSLSRRLDRMGDEAGILLYLITPKDGLKLLSKNLDSPVPIVRDNSAAILATIQTEESIEILKSHGSVTAATMIAIMDNIKIAEIIPLGKEVIIGNKTVRTYSWEEVEAANMENWLKMCYEDTINKYSSLLTKWKI